MSGRDLAEISGLTQSKISRIESGRTAPTVPDITVLLRHLGAPSDITENLVSRVQRSNDDVLGWRRLLRAGLTEGQLRVEELEMASTTIEALQLGLVPGLLQTPEYARAALGSSSLREYPDVEEAIATRLRRQRILYDREKQVTFVLWESCLWSNIVPVSAMRQQILWLSHLNANEVIKLGVVPLDAALPAPFLHPFVIYDGTLVVVELYTGVVPIPGSDVRYYRSLFDSLSTVALYGHDLESILERRSKAFDEARAEP